MLRYVTAASIAGLLLAIALKSRTGEGAADPGSEPPTIAVEKPRVEAARVPGGVDLRLRHRFAGAVSRASLVYDYEGKKRTLDRTTSCEKALDKQYHDGYASEVRLGGRLPEGYSRLRLVVEDETGTHIVPVELHLD